MKLVSVLQVETFLQPRFEFCDSIFFILFEEHGFFQFPCSVVAVNNEISMLSHFSFLFSASLTVLEQVFLNILFGREEGLSKELILGQLGRLKN